MTHSIPDLSTPAGARFLERVSTDASLALELAASVLNWLCSERTPLLFRLALCKHPAAVLEIVRHTDKWVEAVADGWELLDTLVHREDQQCVIALIHGSDSWLKSSKTVSFLRYFAFRGRPDSVRAAFAARLPAWYDQSSPSKAAVNALSELREKSSPAVNVELLRHAESWAPNPEEECEKHLSSISIHGGCVEVAITKLLSKKSPRAILLVKHLERIAAGNDAAGAIALAKTASLWATLPGASNVYRILLARNDTRVDEGLIGNAKVATFDATLGELVKTIRPDISLEMFGLTAS